MSKVKDNLQDLFSKLEGHLSTKTVVGEPVHIGEVILIPLVDVSLGMGTAMVANTEEDAGKKGGKDGGGGALGAKMTPSAVVVVSGGTVQLVNIKNQESVNKVLDMIPGILSKFNLGSIFGKKEEEEPEIVIEVPVETI
ncbi:MAG: sporulation protein [Defluviitaleaceae bacterium]|nr:sporulation protein [Defluviitaleaceae bacterium]